MLAAVLLAEASCLAAPNPPRLVRVLDAVKSEVSLDRAMRHMHEVYARDRWFTFPKFEETAQYLAGALSAAGLKNVEIVRPPADGVTQVGFWTMPLAWDVREARLEVVAPSPPEEFRVLADYRQVPASLGMWSGPTPPEGITAEVVDVGQAGAEEILKLDLKGKVALTGRDPSSLKWALTKQGAVGAINAFTENPDLRDARNWVNAWGDRGWGVTQGDSRLFCFSITPRQAEWLRERLAHGDTVRVKAVVNSRYYEGTYPYTTALLPGSDSREEVLALGHTSEQGAQDNATGVAAMVEAVDALGRLIRRGALARPRRGIRLLAMGEVYGSMHYIAANPERIRSTLAAICLDTPAGFYHLAGTEYTFYLNPHVAKSYVDAFTLKLAELYFSRLSPPRPFHEKPYMMGTDTFLSDPMIGVPTVWPYSGSGVHTHHNSEDTPDDVDPRSLRDLTIVTAAFLYYLASADATDAPWLAELAEARGYRQLLAAADSYALQLRQTEGRAAASGLLRDGLEKLSYSLDRELSAVESVRRLAPGFDTGPAARRLRAFAEQQAARLREAARARGGGSDRKEASQPAPEPASAGMIVRRKRFGTIPLDDLPVEQREGWPSNAWNTRLATVMYWCDGKRTLAEAVRLTRLELGPDEFDYAGYFRFLARKGYVELLPAGGGR